MCEWFGDDRKLHLNELILGQSVPVVTEVWILVEPEKPDVAQGQFRVRSASLWRMLFSYGS